MSGTPTKFAEAPSLMSPPSGQLRALNLLLESPVRCPARRLDGAAVTPSNRKASTTDTCKRGRPRADAISNLIIEGSSSASGIKCQVCSRVFPREKSLQAHLRTHTGEKPYVCDYPGCSRAFTQSGQLKTHQRLHAGEKPFVCSFSGCGNRYTHANRTCPLHPDCRVQRSAEVVLQPTLTAGEDSESVARWLDNYRLEKLDKTPAKVEQGAVITPVLIKVDLSKLQQIKRQSNAERGQENKGKKCPCSPEKVARVANDDESRPRRPALGDITPVKGNTPRSPGKTYHLKKRWLKEVFKDQCGDVLAATDPERSAAISSCESIPDSLAKPIRWDECEMDALRFSERFRNSPHSWSAVSALVELAREQHQPLNLSTARE